MDEHMIEQEKARIKAALEAQEINATKNNDNNRARIYAAHNPEVAKMIAEMQLKEEVQKQETQKARR